MASPCLCKPPMASEPASHVKPVTKQTFKRVSPGAAREATPEALPNVALSLQPRGKLLSSSGRAAPSQSHPPTKPQPCVSPFPPRFQSPRSVIFFSRVGSNYAETTTRSVKEIQRRPHRCSWSLLLPAKHVVSARTSSILIPTCV